VSGNQAQWHWTLPASAQTLKDMNDNRTAGWLLVAGCVAGLVTMSLHPTMHLGVSLSPAELTRLARIDRVVHSLALVGIILVFLGTLALTRRLASAGNRLSLAALVVYAFAAVAVVVAATIDGFVAADLVTRMAAGGPKLESLWMLLEYNTRIVVALSSVYVVGTCVAIFLWSLAALQTGRLARGFAWYGLVAAALITLALLSGHIRLDVHGFGLVWLMQSIWFVVAGCLLMRSVDAEV
jgi:hypothetical protein